ncbi:hypothetical protein GCK72_023873 [Caenorhabditis remanei]|uniref:Uncharacterized protein n=1 Tax=Caenorhabditis remanei TaxID=31234 RepID=A0A6A5FYB9_CAERE|nr:hypothetical protein GCK72_023873 [Caenorhabditis remanei]KAF1747411.1 hypothetical protein GCK72_023873 [Caenorhabditis remanei]
MNLTNIFKLDMVDRRCHLPPQKNRRHGNLALAFFRFLVELNQSQLLSVVVEQQRLVQLALEQHTPLLGIEDVLRLE